MKGFIFIACELNYRVITVILIQKLNATHFASQWE